MYDNPKPSLEQVRPLVKLIIQPLRALQRLQMVHRDLKPNNIMLDKQERIKIIDLGAVQVKGLEEINTLNFIEDEQYLLGAADYIAPEYLIGNTCSHLSDLFSLAIILYEMLSVKIPFKLAKYPWLRNYQTWRYHSIREKRSDIPLWFDLALQKSLTPNPDRRYQSFSEFYYDLCTPNH